MNNSLINLAGRQRMLSQKIAFHCEAVARGRNQFITSLRETIALYEHSFLVIQFGGKPKGIDQAESLPPAKTSLLPLLHSLELLWTEYKNAATAILEWAERKSNDLVQVEAHLNCIEEKSEHLLFQNNALTQACSHLD